MKTLEDLKKIREKALEQMKLREGQFSAKALVIESHRLGAIAIKQQKRGTA